VTNFSSSLFHIRDDVSNTPGPILDTFTPTSVIGGIAQYTGSHPVVPGTKFWIAPGQPYVSFPGCYLQPTADSNLTTDGSIIVDSSVSGVAGIYYGYTTNFITWNAAVPSNFIFQMGLIMNSVSISTVTISNILPADSPLIYRTSYTLTAQLSSPGRVTFYANGKPIPGCKNVLWATSTATCSWKPSVKGTSQLYATLKPTNPAIAVSTSGYKSLNVSARTGNR